jgi:hemolysin TlyA family protein
LNSRLDIYLVEKGITESRERAKALIMAGLIYVNGVKAEKAGEKIPENAEIEVRGNTLQYVSRGGLKLEKAISSFEIDIKDKICMDIGASTGGFTDCMLQNGARKVYAVDVGYGQLAWKLRNDNRVICMERTNIRNVTTESLPEKIEFFSVDVSFISLIHIFPVIKEIATEVCQGVALIKPQFEAGKENVGKKGVVKDVDVHVSVIVKCVEIATANGFFVNGIDFSPVKGPEGNIEFLMLFSSNPSKEIITEEIIQFIVKSAHESL